MVDPFEVDAILRALSGNESGGDYEVWNKQGEPSYGKYQFLPETWKMWSDRYIKNKGLPATSLKQTPENQENVARYKVETLLSEGYKPDEIASIWNSGSPNWHGKVGTNQYGNRYDVPGYVSRFRKTFDKIMDWVGPSEASAAELEKRFIDPFDSPENMQKVTEKSANIDALTKKYKDPFDDPGFIQAPTASQIQSQQFPEPVAASHDPASFRTQVQAGIPDDPITSLRILAKERFPNEDPDQAIRNRYFVKDGEVFYMDNDQKVYREVGEGLSNKSKAFLATETARLPIYIAGITGLALGGVPGAIAGAGAGAAIKKGMASTLGEPQTPVDYIKPVVGEMAGALAGEVGSAGLNAIANRVLRAGTGKIGTIAKQDIRTINPAQALDNVDLGRRFGVDLTVPEATGSPALRGAWNDVANTPGASADLVEGWREGVRIPQVREAITRQLDEISPIDDPRYAAWKGVDAGKRMMGKFEDFRTELGNTAYENAFKNAPEIDTTEVLHDVTKMIFEAPRGSHAEKALMRVRSMMTRPEEVTEEGLDYMTKGEAKSIAKDAYARIDEIKKIGITPDSIRKDYGGKGIAKMQQNLPGIVKKSGRPLDEMAADHGFESADDLAMAILEYNPRYKFIEQGRGTRIQGQEKVDTPEKRLRVLDTVKKEIDLMLEGPESASIHRDTKRQLMIVKDKLTSIADAHEEKYRIAREAFGEASKPINDMLYGSPDVGPGQKPLTILGKLLNLDEANLEKAPQMLFGESSSPWNVRKAKQYISREDPEAWNALVRGYLQERLDLVPDKIGQGTGVKYRDIVFGKPRQQKMLEAAMTKEQFQTWSDFMDLLQLTDRTVYRNSLTAYNITGSRAIEEGAGGVPSKIMKGVGKIRSGALLDLGTWAELRNQMKSPEYRLEIAKMLIDPSSIAKIKRMKRLPNATEKAVEMVGLIGSLRGSAELMEPDEFFPEGSPNRNR